MYLAQGHNAVTPMRLEPAAPWSRVVPQLVTKSDNKTPSGLNGYASLILHVGGDTACALSSSKTVSAA